MSVTISSPTETPTETPTPTADARVVTKDRAFAAIAALKGPKAIKTLTALATDGQEPTRVRRQAVDSLSRIDDPAVVATLVSVLDDADPGVAGRAAIALGRAGSTEAVAALTAIDAAEDSVLASRALFATSLLAHRFDLDGHDLVSPAGPGHLTVSARAVAAKVAPAPPEVVAAAVAGVTEAMPAFVPGGPSLVVDCGAERQVLVLSREAAEVIADPRLLLQRRWHLGQLAVENPSDGRVSPGLTLLSTPNGEKADIGVYRSDATLVYGGSGALKGDTFVARLSASRRPGAVAVSVVITIGGGSLDLAVQSDATRTVEPNHPTPA